MLANLKLLLKLRTWLKSGTLFSGGVIGILGAVQTWLGTTDGMGILEMVAAALNMMSATIMGLFTSAVGLLMVLLRAKTEWSLKEKVDGTNTQ